MFVLNNGPDYNSFTVNTCTDFCDTTFSAYSEKNSFIVLHQNIRSLRQNFDALVCQLSSIHRWPDFIFVTEIWIYSSEINSYSIPGYNFFAFPNDKYSAGGVGVFIKSNLSCRTLSCNLASADTMEVNFVIGRVAFTIVCFYRLHSGPVHMFLTELDNFLQYKNANNLLLVGDFNIDMLEDSDAIDSYISLLSKYGLYSFLNTPTRKPSGSCLDHVIGRFTTPQSTFDCFNFDLDLTDHYMTGLAVQILNDRPTQRANLMLIQRSNQRKVRWFFANIQIC